MKQNNTFEFSWIKLIVKIAILILMIYLYNLVFGSCSDMLTQPEGITLSQFVAGLVMWLVALIVILVFNYGAHRKTRKHGTRS